MTRARIRRIRARFVQVSSIGDRHISVELDLDRVEIAIEIWRGLLLYICKPCLLGVHFEWFPASGPPVTMREQEIAGEDTIEIRDIATHHGGFHVLFKLDDFSHFGSIRRAGSRRPGRSRAHHGDRSSWLLS